MGTAVLSVGFGRLFHPTTIVGVIWKEWLLDIAIAGSLGFCAYRISRSRLGAWVWVLPSVWFTFRVLPLLLTTHTSVLFHSPTLWYEISGQGCVNGLRDFGCINFFVFTVPFTRSIVYSAGTLIGAAMIAPSRLIDPQSGPGDSAVAADC
jgi:hypothetical protein